MSILVDEEEPLFDVEEQPFEPRDVKVRSDVWVKDEFEILDFLGRGKFGEVKRCKEKHSNKEFAAKFICAARPQDKKDVEHEIKIMQQLQHKRLLQLYDAFANKTEMCLVLEIILGGELFDRVILDDFILTERACICFVRQICEGIDYMHSKGIVHLDMKPENILCLTKTGNRIKIIDFGLAREYNPSKELRVLFGTPEFMAPEVVQYDPIHYATDMWSVGVICYVLLSGLSPFMGENDGETLANVTKGEVEFDYEEFDDVSEDAKDFMKKLLIKSPKGRMSAEEAIEHAWLKRPKKFNRQLNMSKKRLKRFVYRRKWQKYESHRKFLLGKSLFYKITHYKQHTGRVIKNKGISSRKKVVNAIIALKRMGVPLGKLKQRSGDEKISYGESIFGWENRRSMEIKQKSVSKEIESKTVSPTNSKKKASDNCLNNEKSKIESDQKKRDESAKNDKLPNSLNPHLDVSNNIQNNLSTSPESKKSKTRTKIQDKIAKFTPKLEVNSISINKKSKAMSPMRGKEIEFNELSCSKFKISNVKTKEPIIEEACNENSITKPKLSSKRSQRKSSSDNENGSRGMKARPTGERIDISYHINDVIEKQNSSIFKSERVKLSPSRYFEDHETPHQRFEPTIPENFHEEFDKVVTTGVIKYGSWSGNVVCETFIKTVNYTKESIHEKTHVTAIECNQDTIVYEASLTVT